MIKFESTAASGNQAVEAVLPFICDVSETS